MEFNEVENLSEAQILDLYSDIVGQSDIISSPIPSVYYSVPGGMTYSIGCMGSYYGNVNCGYHEQFTYRPGPYCDYDYVYVISYYDCPVK